MRTKLRPLGEFVANFCDRDEVATILIVMRHPNLLYSCFAHSWSMLSRYAFETCVIFDRLDIQAFSSSSARPGESKEGIMIVKYRYGQGTV